MLSVTDPGAVVQCPQELQRSHHQSFQADEPQSVPSTDRELVEVMAISHGSMTGEANFTIIRYDLHNLSFEVSLRGERAFLGSNWSDERRRSRSCHPASVQAA
jgi:hypothetical protein